MQVGVLTTDGGPHPADKWARMTAWMLSNHLIEVDEKAASKRAQEIREARDELNQRLYKLLKEHHAKVQDGERAKIKELGSKRLAHPLNAAEHADVDALVDKVVKAADVHPEIRAHFGKDETKDAIRAQLHRDFGSVMDIERDWHANGHVVVDGLAKPNLDHDPRDPHVKAWKQARAKL